LSKTIQTKKAVQFEIEQLFLLAESY